MNRVMGKEQPMVLALQLKGLPILKLYMVRTSLVTKVS
jgi:hypothetical protein